MGTCRRLSRSRLSLLDCCCGPTRETAPVRDAQTLLTVWFGARGAPKRYAQYGLAHQERPYVMHSTLGTALILGGSPLFGGPPLFGGVVAAIRGRGRRYSGVAACRYSGAVAAIRGRAHISSLLANACASHSCSATLPTPFHDYCYLLLLRPVPVPMPVPVTSTSIGIS